MFRRLTALVVNRLWITSSTSSLTVRLPSLPAHVRAFSAPPAPVKPRVPIQVTFEQVRRELSKPGTVLLDVREPGELVKDGRISDMAKNIPLGQLEKAFELSSEEFETTYGFPKPGPTTTVVTHCRLGIRATKGAMSLTKAGFQNVLVYPGIADWTENGGELVK